MKRGLLRERHALLGLRLARMSDDLDGVAAEVARAYRLGSRQAKAVSRAVVAVRRARLAMEGACAAEVWHGNNECVRLYWPQPQQRKPRLVWLRPDDGGDG